MNETITISRKDYDSLLRTLGRADACVSYLLSEYNENISHFADAGLALKLLGFDMPGEPVVDFAPKMTVEEE